MEIQGFPLSSFLADGENLSDGIDEIEARDEAIDVMNHSNGGSKHL